MKSKIISTVIALSLVFGSAIPAFANSIDEPSRDYTIVEDDMLQTMPATATSLETIVTVSEIQELMDSRTSALLNGNQEAYENITNTLREYGVKEASYEDIIMLLGDEAGPMPLATPDSTSTTNNSVFEYYYTTYTYSGTTYDVMRILASPNMNTSGDTILYHSSTKTLYNTKAAKIIATNLFTLGVESAIGHSTVGGAALTLADVWDAVSSGLDTSSTVSSVTATYNWNLAEDCSWIYVSNKDEENYKLSARYHKASMGVLIGIPKLVVNNMNSTAYINSVNKQITATPTNYDSTYQAVKKFASGSGVYQSLITSLPVTGIEGQTVATAQLSNPYYPLYAQ